MPKKIKNAYVWCEDGSFVNKGEIINYTKYYLNVNGVDLDIQLDKQQLKLIKQGAVKIDFEEIDGIKVQ